MRGDAGARVSGVCADQCQGQDEAELSPHIARRCGDAPYACGHLLASELRTVQPFAVALSPGCLAAAGAGLPSIALALLYESCHKMFCVSDLPTLYCQPSVHLCVDRFSPPRVHALT